MKTLEKGQEKINKICSVLREETLEPAKKQAEEIINEGRKQAEAIIAAAQKEAEVLLASARTAMTQERNVFHSSLQQAARQSLEALRQDIESRFFSDHLEEIVIKNGASPDLIARLINAIIKALEKEGLAADLTALVPEAVTPQEINALLLHDFLNTLKEKTVSIGKFSAGAQVKINNKRMTIDISEEALKELLASYIVRKDFRKMIFGTV